MSKTFQSPYIQSVRNAGVQFTATDTTTQKAVGTAGSEGSVLKTLGIVNSYAAPATIMFAIDPDGSGTIKYPLGAVLVPSSAGYDGTTAVLNVLAALASLSYDAAVNKQMNLAAGAKLYANAMSTLSGGTITILAEFGDL